MTMNHTEWLDAYFDQELDPTQTQVVEQHLSSCEQCRATLEERAILRRELQSLNGISSVKSDQRFLDEIRLEIQKREIEPAYKPLTKLFWYLVPVTLLLALIMFQIYGWFVGLINLIPGANQFIVTNFSTAMAAGSRLFWFPSLFSFNFNFIGIASPFQWNFINQIAAVTALAVLYCVWMALLLLKNQRQSVNL